MYLVVDLGDYLRISLLQLNVRHHLTQQTGLNNRTAITVTQTTGKVMLLPLVGCQGIHRLHRAVKLRVRHLGRTCPAVLLQLADRFTDPGLLVPYDAVHYVVGDERGRYPVVGMGGEVQDVRVDVLVSEVRVEDHHQRTEV